MAKNLPNILYTEGNIFESKKITSIIDARESLYQIPYKKDYEYFSNIESRNNFIKGCEKLIRTNPRYKKYIMYLKKEVKLDHCQVLSNLNDEDCPIEMHHGPIFTLYDYCDIMIDFYLSKAWDVTTFSIADAILEEHYKNRIQVVMLSETVHAEVHDREIFISLKHGFGDLNTFLKMYGKTMDNTLKEKFNKYIDRCMMYDSDDYGLLQLNKKLFSL